MGTQLKIKTALAAIALLPVFVAVTSCTASAGDLAEPHAQHALDRSNGVDSDGIEVRSFEYEGHRVSLISQEGRHTAVLELSYRWKSGGENESGRAIFDRIFDIGSFEHRWLDAYLNHAALRLAGTGERRPYVSYEIVESSVSKDALHDFKWFFEGANSIEWCPASLAWRHNGEVVQFIKHETDKTCERWTPLTQESFYEWYKNLDERVELEALLGSVRKKNGGR